MPIASIAAGLLAAVIVLPSALRPPPDPATSSGAINPNAPPNQNPNQLLESLQEAGGGGAGGGAAGGGSTTTVPGAKNVTGSTPTTVPAVASLGYCYGNPPRQIPSVYAGPCVGAWHGDNGGATSLNVFPNEIRIGVNNLGSPDKGRVPPESQDNSSTSSATVTWQALEDYFNQRYQLYNRKVVFYGLSDPSLDNASDYAAAAAQYANSQQLFGIIDSKVGVCQDFVRYGLIAMCDPQTDAQYNQYRPGMFSQYTNLDVMFEFGAEFACKSLRGRTTKYGGADVNGKPRKLGFLGWNAVQGGVDASLFARDFSALCGGQVETATLSSANDAAGASAAVTRFKADGVTTIMFSNQAVNVDLAMQHADGLAYTPEWVMLGEYADDNNTIGELFPTTQSSHLFGLAPIEWPRPPPETECYVAFHTVHPAGSPDGTTCTDFWVSVVLLLDGLQGAGPHLTPATFQLGMFGLGHRFGDPVWKIGGGFGPGSYAYQDAMGEVWFSPTAIDPTNGPPGAYVWINGGRKYQLGQLPAGDAGFFSSGSPVAPDS